MGVDSACVGEGFYADASGNEGREGGDVGGDALCV